MFNKPKPTQLELFSPPDRNALIKRGSPSSFFEKFASNYEKSIITGICFIVIFIVAYALGIERGKRIILAENKNRLLNSPLSSLTFELPGSSKMINDSSAKPSKPPSQKLAPEKIDFKEDGYTVQVASFKNKDSAEREKAQLKKKGFQAYTLSKKSYIIVCVGAYENEDKAQLSLKQLRRIYTDCLIRRL